MPTSMLKMPAEAVVEVEVTHPEVGVEMDIPHHMELELQKMSPNGLRIPTGALRSGA